MKIAQLCLLAGCLLLGVKVHAQPDSLFVRPPDSSFIRPIWMTDSLLALQDTSLQLAVTKKKKRKATPLRLRLPIFVENNRLQFRLRLPLREDLGFTFPKFVYAGPAPPFDPKVAWVRSLIIPGWGQIYNHAYWKVPIMYAGYGFMGYLLVTTANDYTDYQRAYRIRIQQEQDIPISDADSLFLLSDPVYTSSDPDGLLARRDNLRRNRDFLVILSLGYHLLWVIEAYINAHLKGLDVSDDLSIHFGPGMMGLRPRENGMLSLTPGARITLSF